MARDKRSSQKEGHREEGEGQRQREWRTDGPADILVPGGGWQSQRLQKALPPMEQGRSGEGTGLLKMRCFPLHTQSWRCKRYL